MRLPYGIIRFPVVRALHFAKISVAILFSGMIVSASAANSKLVCAPARPGFGNIVVGRTQTYLVTVTNAGPTSVTISGIDVGNADFTTSGVQLPLVLPSEKSVDLSVSFTPTKMGWTGGTIRFSSGPTNSILGSLEVGGTGVASEGLAASPSIVSFGQVAVGAISTVPIVLTNARSWKMTLSSPQAIGSGFSISGPTFPLTLDAGQSVKINIVFAPHSAGTVGGRLFVSGPDLAIPLTGSGISPVVTPGQLTANPKSLSFTNIQVGKSLTQSITLANSGGSSLSVSQPTLSSNSFTLSGLTDSSSSATNLSVAKFPLTLNPGQTVSLNVQFHPLAAGTSIGQLIVIGNSSISTDATISLNGTGIPSLVATTPVAPAPTVSPRSGTFTDTATVTMSSTIPGAVIRYTIDGSAPTTSSPIYAAPITLSPQETVTELFQAIATASGYLQSSSTTATFTVTVSASQAQIATIDWNHVDQVIDGFGASDAFEPAPLTSAQATLLFSPTAGVGLSLLRTQVPGGGSCATVNATCAGEVSDMQLAIANGARVWSTPWSPPASMKSNGSMDNGGNLLTDSYATYATYLANYVKSLSSLDGINLYALSVQNEPEEDVWYDSAIWTPTNFDTFIGSNLGPAFANEGLSTLIMMPETSTWQDLGPYEETLMNNPTTAAYVSIIATHDYAHVAGSPSYLPNQGQGKRLWETEVCDLNALDVGMTSALKYAQHINDWMVNGNANAWHYWWLIDENDSDNQGLITSSGIVTKRLYMMGNYSKFVRPGFYRIDVTAAPQSGVSVSAYKNATNGTLVIVVINQNSSSVSQDFLLNGANVSAVTPWITSASLDLAQQPPVAVGSGAFTYSLPGSSITSFVANTTADNP